MIQRDILRIEPSEGFCPDGPYGGNGKDRAVDWPGLTLRCGPSGNAPMA